MAFSDLIYIILVFEVLAAIIATIYYKKYKNTTERYFLYYLWAVFFVEMAGLSYWKILKSGNNYWIYIIYTYFSFLFFFYWFYSILEKKKYKKILLFLAFIFSVYGIYNFMVLSWNQYQIPTFVCGAIITIISALLYFSELLDSDKVLNVKTELRFWIATGLLLFNVGMTPFMIFSDYFKSDNRLFVIILVSLNFILYGCYSLGFIWLKPKNK
ncbi:hypothetical protein [Tenacibaculum sp. UWU-22]|uniref:hypothetical protein n=1 Tax=Tenacibaculum sp. UWU-22 TaxID=3234187 RepID=UPI0034DAEFE6